MANTFKPVLTQHTGKESKAIIYCPLGCIFKKRKLLYVGVSYLNRTGRCTWHYSF